MRKFVLGLDEGTTNLKAALFDVEKMQVIDSEKRSFKRFFPHEAWVEQDADEIFRKILAACKALLKRNEVQKEELLAISLTNQRETVVAWDKETGKPLCNAIVWQCRRTTNYIKSLSQKRKERIKELTGLIPNPYFSASKFKWILENVKEANKLLKKNRLCFGTIDSYLIFRLTDKHLTDTTNASRTMLMNLKTLDWDDELLKIFKIPRQTLPKIMPCDADFGEVKSLLGAHLRAVIGDQQSSMLGQSVLGKNECKVTFGTGGFVLMNIGNNPNKRLDNLITTVAHTIGGKTEYAIEGSIYSACSAINFLQDNLSLFDDVSKTSKMALSLPSNENVYFVPAFTGLGAPYWKDDARGMIVGMTFDTKKAHIVRACLESMAYNTKDILDEIKRAGLVPKFLSVDGGGSQNEFLLQFLADILNHEIVKSKNSDATILGAIYLSVMALKEATEEQIKEVSLGKNKYMPNMNEEDRKRNIKGWKKALKKI